MQQAEARAKLASPTDVEAPVATTISRAEVEQALRAEGDPPDLVLDVVRGRDGDSERRNVSVEWNRDDLERLLSQAEGDSITLTFDAKALDEAFADVDAHGIREVGVVLAAVVAGAAAGNAAASPAEFGYVGGDRPAAVSSDLSAIEQARGAGGAAADAASSAAMASSYSDVEGARGEAAAPEYGMPRPTPADYATPATGEVASPDIVAGGYETPATTPVASPDVVSGGYGSPAEYGMPQPTPADYATPATGEVASPDIVSGGYGSPAEYGMPRPVPADYERPAATGDDGGLTLDTPSPVQMGIAGALALAIVGAAFVARSQRQRLGTA